MPDRYFYPSQGIRQGCCCSPSLFTLSVVLLAILVRKAEHIQGVTIQGKCAEISQYADDAIFYIKNPASLLHLLDLLEAFPRLSGLKNNKHKSHLLLLGNLLQTPSIYMRHSSGTESQYFGHDLQGTYAGRRTIRP